MGNIGYVLETLEDVMWTLENAMKNIGICDKEKIRKADDGRTNENEIMENAW